MAVHRYWKIVVTANNDAWPSLQVAEIEFRATIGGARLVGTLFATKVYAPNPPALANDVDFTTLSISDGGLGMPVELGIDLGGSPSDVLEVAISPGNGLTTYAPRDFTLQFSDDNVTYTTALTVAAIPAANYTYTTYTAFNGGVSPTVPRVSQLALVSPSLASPPPMRVSQLILITPLEAEPPPVRLSQLVLISVVQNNQRYVPLQEVIGLPCWQPCTSFGYNGRIITNE